MSGELDGKVALVTGASKGIGYAIAKALAARGAHIIAVARGSGGLEALDDEIQAMGASATLTPLDLTEFERIDALGGIVAEKWGKLDVLVGNAAMLGPLGPITHLEPGVWDDLLALNLSANWRLLRAFDPLLRAADDGRALFITSSVASNPRAYWGGYAAGKAALEAVVKTYAQEVEKTAVRANLFNPGGTRTDMRAQAMPGEDPNTLPSPDEVAASAVKMCLPSWRDNGVLVNHRDRA